MSNNEITDPKLLRFKRAAGAVKGGTKPDITKVADRWNKPDQSISLIIDGKKEEIKPELILTEYKCNKCSRKFNHTPRQAAAGMLPKCPDCDA